MTSMDKLELLHIPYSPWSEKARFALGVRNIAYVSRIYQPILGELPLRLRLQKLTGRVSVPVLFTPDGPVEDSFAIARWAAAHGSGPELFPSGAEAEIGRWNAVSERALAAGRALSLGRVLGDREALLEMVPKGLRGVLGSLGVKVAAAGVRRTLRKYDAIGKEHARGLVEAFGELRRGILAAPANEVGPRYLLGQLTYADIAAAQVVAFIAPPTTGLRIGPANRRAFTDATLGAQWADLVRWRDALYARHRATPTG